MQKNNNSAPPQKYTEKIKSFPIFSGRWPAGLPVPKYVLCLCVLLLAGCASIKESKQISLLENITTAYETAIRWSRYKEASDFMMTHGTQQQAVNFKKLQKTKVTSYELLNRKISKDKLLARQTVEIRYYNSDSMIEKTLIDTQAWEYDKGEKTWRLQGGLPDFK
ncbi:MAG: hypothetical protein L0922_07195 [Candidatus Mariimomonas ferrooxydans]